MTKPLQVWENEYQKSGQQEQHQQIQQGQARQAQLEDVETVRKSPFYK
jgi:hypothetical protein